MALAIALGSTLGAYSGPGYIAAHVTVAGVPSARAVHLFSRGNAVIDAARNSTAGGDVRIDGLSPDIDFDLIGRDWLGVYNDVIWSRVRAVSYDVISLSGAFTVNAGARTLEGALAVVGGDAHVVSTSGTPPPGITYAVVIGEPPQFDHAGFWVVASGSAPAGSYAWDLTVTAANGAARRVSLTAVIP